MTVKKIEIKKQVTFGELEGRLRTVSLRGFPDVRIYENADIQIRCLTPKKVRKEIFTPQLSVYRPQLEHLGKVADLFSQEGIDIFRLNGGFDYEAHDENGEVTEWTILPSVVEVLPFKFGLDGGLDYSGLIGEKLRAVMEEKGYQLNPEVEELDYPEYEEFRGRTVLIPEICDGSHRIEAGIRRGLEQNILFIDRVAPSFPYYAAPKPYSVIHEEPERVEEKLDKTHVLTSPGHKVLYRLFPSGGINSGNVRPLKEKFD